jgi:hypothetical protein
VVVCESAKEDVFSNNSSLEEKLEVIKRAKYGVAHVTYLKLK